MVHFIFVYIVEIDLKIENLVPDVWLLLTQLRKGTLRQWSETFFALRTGFSLAIFCAPALNKLMNVWDMQIYYNS